jgi:radical SAM superfamily enzyme YgiQ (UPF0313 family)
MFYDASLTIDPTYTKQLFKAMKPLRKRFFCNGNVDVLANDLRLVKLSKEAGCIAWLIGFESISQDTIDKVGKKTNKVDDYLKAVENIHNNRMAVIGCFMFGFDTDHQNVFQDTLKMIQQLKIDVCDFCVLTPFPGTPLYKRLKKEGRIITNEWEKYNLKTLVFQPKRLEVDEIHKGISYMYDEFYSLSYTIKRLVRGLQLGIYPFFLILGRNMIATMNSRRPYQK